MLLVDTRETAVGNHRGAVIEAHRLLLDEPVCACRQAGEATHAPKGRVKWAWFTRVCIWVTVRLICFRARARAQRSGTRNRER